MKVYISVDIEGVTGVVSWDQTGPDRNDYTYARRQMTAEAVAACQGAIDAGAGQILLKDAHNNARNIEPDAVPACVRLSRGWSGHPLFMMDDIDGSYDAAVLIGYHSRAGSGGSPLAHTMSSSRIATISINGQTVSEAIINTMAAGSLNVPTVFVSGDELLCQDVRSYNHAVTTVATQRGKGDSVICIQPATAVIMIQQGVAKALKGNIADCLTPLPPSLDLVIEFRDAKVAYARSFYPGARLIDDRRVEFKTGECFEMLRAIAFMVL